MYRQPENALIYKKFNFNYEVKEHICKTERQSRGMTAVQNSEIQSVFRDFHSFYDTPYRKHCKG